MIDRIIPMTMRPILFVSGVFFTAKDLPAAVRDVLIWNPVLHAVEMVRDGWFISYHADYVEITYVLFWVLGCAYLGLLLERLSRRRLELT